MRKALLIAYHFPPIKGSSGIQRTLSMARYLRENGWEPIVLSITPSAYRNVSDDQLKDIPDGVLVKRAFGRDTSRHLSILGRYPRLLALPDSWVSWFIGGVISGIKLIRKQKPDVIWSTYPIATAHMIGLALARYSGLPWIADFRDSMTEPGYPSDKRQWKAYRWIERNAVRHADKVVFTTPGTRRMYRERYPGYEEANFEVVPNGFDEELFKSAEKKSKSSKDADIQYQGSLRLLHSGILYPSERDPTHFFDALAELKVNGKINAQCLNIMLRATGHDRFYRPMLEKRNIQDIVSLLPGIGYEDALAEMTNVDGLLLFQASNCNHQIPAKVYEYFRSGKPLIAFTDAKGDTAGALREAGINSIAALDDKNAIMEAILQFMGDLEYREAARVALKSAQKYSRRSIVKNYSEILNSVCL